MKINDANDVVVEREGLGSDGAFGIVFNAKMAKILSDGLYSDKIGSIIRELCCNAIDSHVEAGCAKRPIEVHLPTIFEPWFHVRDFGVGLDHAQVIGIFTTYGASTKTNSNDFIGQLGLGSKSPFSYVDAFDVTARKHGVERQYSMYKNEQGMPSVALMGEKPTTDPNGVIIKMPVKSDDMRRFAEKAAKVFRWFDVTPDVVGPSDFTVPKHEAVFSGKGWQIRKMLDTYRHANGNAPVALMGRVAYPLDAGSLQNATDTHRALLNMPVTLEFGIGELEVAASREALGYDKRTQENILARIDVVVRELAEEFERQIAAAPTEWEARKLFGTIFGNGTGFRYDLERIYGRAGLSWRGRSIKVDHVVVDTKTLWPAANQPDITRSHQGTKRMQGMSYHENFVIRCSDKTVIMFDDLETGGASRIRYYHETTGYDNGIYCFHTVALTKTVDEVVQMLGHPKYLLTSQLPKRPSAKRTRVNMLEHRAGYEKSKAWAPVEVTAEDGGYYIQLNGYTPIYNDQEFNGFGSVIDMARTIGILADTDSVYAPRGKLKKELSESDSWVNVLDYIKEEVSKRLTPQVIQAVADYNQFRVIQEICSGSSVWQATLLIADNTGPYARFRDALLTLSRDAASNSKHTSLIQLAHFFGTNVPTATPTIDAKDLHDLCKLRYPMMFMAMESYSNRNVTSNNRRAYQDYINMCDAFHNGEMIRAAETAINA